MRVFHGSALLFGMLTCPAFSDVLVFDVSGRVVQASSWNGLPDASQNQKPLKKVAEADGEIAVAPQAVVANDADIQAELQKVIARHSSNGALKAAEIAPEEWANWFTRMIRQESGFRQDAVSPKGAIGLGQLMPTTASDLGVDPYDMAQNLDGSARYLLAQLARFGDMELALAAYNSGPATVAKYGAVPPIDETQNYIAAIAGRSRANAGAGKRTLLAKEAAALRAPQSFVMTFN